MNERMKKIKFVVNPISGTQSKELILNLLDEKIDKARYSWEVVYTERAGHAVEIAAKAAEEKTDIVAVSYTHLVVGVVKNFSYRSPTSKPGLIAFQRPEAQEYLLNRASILFKFKEGTWNECREAIEKLHKEEFPNAYLRLFSEEEEYGKYPVSYTHLESGY